MSVRFKVVPAPREVDLEDARRAVPLVPEREDDCCVRLAADLGLRSRDEAREWLTFLRALGLVERGPSGFRRVRREADPGALREAFRERVYGAEEALCVLADADGPLPAGAVFECLREHVPPWERARHTDPERVWRERTERLLEWLARLGLAERADGGYAVG